jgi:hypothetical protein
MVLSDMVRGCVCGCVVPRGAGGQLTNKHKWGGEGKIRTILFDTNHCLNNPPSYF